MTIALMIAACGLSFAAFMAALLAWRTARAPASAQAHPELLGRLHMAEQAVRDAPRDIRADLATLKTELQQALAIHNQGIEHRLNLFQQEQGGHLGAIRREAGEGRAQAAEALAGHVRDFSHTQTTRLGETNIAMKELRERTEATLAAMTGKLEALNAGAAERQEAQRAQLQTNLDAMRDGNEKKLDEMKGVVDEKLSATLDQRLGEKFKIVSDQLEAVHRGVGEMNALATGFGDMKRVLTNVRVRGTWGELRLGQLLEDMLTPDQYESQVQVRSGAGERVDFAVKLPGRNDDGAPLWLPIDCKFPQEDYERLQLAQERGDPGEVEACAVALEKAVRIQAKSIAAKYVHPPQTTPFAILYLPTEGLFAEVIRRPGLVSELQTKLNVNVTGPTTLAALLSSLKMGFDTLRMQKSSAEVWKVLGEAKAEFAQYGKAWELLGKRLDQAKSAHDDVAVRNRAVERKLRGVEALEPSVVAVDVEPLLALPAGEGEAEAA